MAEREIWFRARRPDEGTGYSLTHWKGGVVVAAWTFSLVVAVAASYFIIGVNWLALGVGLAFAVGWSRTFLGVIKAHSGRSG